jgi:uncharacterized protein
MVDIQEYLRMREWPGGGPVMIQKWRDLAFLHFSLDPKEVQKHLPPALTVDTFPDEKGRERAWIAVAPFRMFDVRVPFLPPVPGLDAFPETNVRTYVHLNGRDPGVWFFSLDIGSSAATAAARSFYGLPYFRASMRCARNDTIVSYQSMRWDSTWQKTVEGKELSAVANMRIEIGEDIGLAEPGSLEFFLIERYLLYGMRGETLTAGRVNHEPYPLRKATILNTSDTLIEAAGFKPKAWEHVVFSPGVNVKVFAPMQAAASAAAQATA